MIIKILLQYVFGGVFESFITLTLDVKNKKNIAESLEAYVKDQVIDSYKCDIC